MSARILAKYDERSPWIRSNVIAQTNPETRGSVIGKKFSVSPATFFVCFYMNPFASDRIPLLPRGPRGLPPLERG